jgi:hypothetical protein
VDRLISQGGIIYLFWMSNKLWNSKFRIFDLKSNRGASPLVPTKTDEKVPIKFTLFIKNINFLLVRWKTDFPLIWLFETCSSDLYFGFWFYVSCNRSWNCNFVIYFSGFVIWCWFGVNKFVQKSCASIAKRSKFKCRKRSINASIIENSLTPLST